MNTTKVRNDSNSTESDPPISKSLTVGVPLMVILVWVGSWYLIIMNSNLKNWSERGTFGDMFGAVNALFSGLAFAGVIVALYLQKKELSLQREELRATRAEVKGQREQLELQNFEHTFFQLLRVHNDFVQSLEIWPDAKGKAGMKRIYKKFVTIFRQQNWNSDDDHQKDINRMYSDAIKELEAYVEVYFENILNMLDFIDTSKITDKLFYTRILKSQIPMIEEALIYIYANTDSSSKKFKTLVGKSEITTTFESASGVNRKIGCYLGFHL